MRINGTSGDTRRGGVGSLAVAALVIAMAGGSASASFSRAFDRTGDEAGEDVLRGPKVRQSAPPGGSPGFSEMENRFMRAANQPVPYRMFLQAVRSLGADRAPKEIALSEPQGEAIRTIQREHTQALMAYVGEHREEIEGLIQKADLPVPPMGRGAQGREGEAGRPAREGRPGRERPAREAEEGDIGNRRPDRADRGGQGADGGRGPGAERQIDQANRELMRLMMMVQALDSGRIPASDDATVNAARTRLAALGAGAPSPEEAKAKVWAVLTPEQQAHVTSTIEKARAEMQKRLEEREMLDDRAPQRRGASPEANPDNRRPAPGQERQRKRGEQRPDV